MNNSKIDLLRRKEQIFNLYDRVKLGMNFLSNNVDKRQNCRPFFSTMFKNDPAENRHDFPDFCDLTSRYIEAFIVSRKMLGITEPNSTENALKELFFSYFDCGDGFSYRPKPSKPYYSIVYGCMYDAHEAEGFDQARVLWALIELYESEQETSVLKRIKDILEGMKRVMVFKDDYGYYDRGKWEPNFIVDHQAAPMLHQFYFAGTQIQPLIECYKRCGIDLALELASRLAKYIVYVSEYFEDNGTFKFQDDKNNPFNVLDGHVHSRLATVAGCIDISVQIKDAEMLHRMKFGFDDFITNHSSSFGWIPEFLNRHGDPLEGCETCAVMDMLKCCISFAQAGYKEYYSIAERIARNQLLENQLLDTKLIVNNYHLDDSEQSVWHSVADMVRGGFAGWAAPNDFIGNCDMHFCLMNCCGPAGIRALYDIWSSIYSYDGRDLNVNILMDKYDNVVEIKHFQPYENLIEITANCRLNLSLPLRNWLETPQALLNGRKIELVKYPDRWYVAPMNKNDKVVISYNTDEKVKEEFCNGRLFKTRWRGDTVVGISPNGRYMPFYSNRL